MAVVEDSRVWMRKDNAKSPAWADERAAAILRETLPGLRRPDVKAEEAADEALTRANHKKQPCTGRCRVVYKILIYGLGVGVGNGAGVLIFKFMSGLAVCRLERR